MSPWIGIIVLCAVPGILAGILQFFLLKKSGKSGSMYRMIVCYTALFYGALSLVKMILDSGNITLVESFEDIVPATYLHYLILLIPMAIIIPYLIGLLFRNTDISGMMSLFDSVMFGILALGYIIAGRVSNVFYVTVLIISILTALGGTFFYKGKIVYFSPDDLKRRIKYAAAPTLLYVVTIILSLPGTLFLNNISEITIMPTSFAKALLVGASVHFILIVGIGVFLLTWRQLELFYTVLFAVTLSGYIQNMILNGHMMSMDGEKQTWQGRQIWINLLIWVILITCILLIKALIHKDVAKIYRVISIYLSLVEVVSLGFLAVNAYMKKNSSENSNTEWILTTNGALELHPDNNVLVFVLDWYDEQILERILQEDEDFLSPLDGFTHYSNVTSMYAFTGMAIPYLLTGVEWQYNMESDEYVKYAYSNRTMLDDIYDAGYDIDIYANKMHVDGVMTGKLRNYALFKHYCDTWDTVKMMLTCSKYQMAPFGLKNKYWYTTDQINALVVSDGFVQWDTSSDLPFWTALNETGISIEENAVSAGNFKFYHLYGAHAPYGMTEDFDTPLDLSPSAAMVSQAKGSMKVVFEYIDQLKELGLYDSATIIITADHGENYLFNPGRTSIFAELELENTSNPILLVKNAGQSAESIRQTSAPVSHTDVIASIVDAINPQAAVNYGNTLADIAEDAERERIFISTRHDVPYVKVVITGNARDMESWTVVETVPVDQK